MVRPKLEVAEIFRRHGDAWRTANASHVNLAQRRVMTAIEICRTAALGGHVEHCQDCAHTRVAYNSCRNRHCPKCQWRAAAAWLVAREAEVLPVPYFHFVFPLPAVIGEMAYQNKAKIYRLLFKAASDTLTTIAADRKHLGAKIGVIAVLHTWAKTFSTTLMYTAWFRVAASRRMVSVGLPAGPDSFFRFACSRACFGVSS
jgi:hypothetical protein